MLSSTTCNNFSSGNKKPAGVRFKERRGGLLWGFMGFYELLVAGADLRLDRYKGALLTRSSVVCLPVSPGIHQHA